MASPLSSLGLGGGISDSIPGVSTSATSTATSSVGPTNVDSRSSVYSGGGKWGLDNHVAFSGATLNSGPETTGGINQPSSGKSLNTVVTYAAIGIGLVLLFVLIIKRH